MSLAPTQYTVNIDTQSKEDGITAARLQYNADQSLDNPDFVPLTDNGQYVQFVMNRAAASYARMYGT